MLQNNNTKFQNRESNNEIDTLASLTALLSGLEIGLGAMLHTFKIPLAGHFMGLNQCFLLSRANLKLKNTRLVSLKISISSALMKTLAPMGKKLTPMLAISMQGLLHTLPLLFGIGPLQILMANALASLWPIIQPLLIYYLLFGKKLFWIVDYYLDKLSILKATGLNDLSDIILFLVFIKILLSIFVTILSYQISDEKFQDYFMALDKFKFKSKKKEVMRPLRGAIKDTLSAPFLFSLALIFVFYYWVESDLSMAIVALLRPLAMGLVFFYIGRKIFSYKDKSSN